MKFKIKGLNLHKSNLLEVSNLLDSIYQNSTVFIK